MSAAAPTSHSIGNPVATAQGWLSAGRPDRSVVALVRHGLVENPQGLRYGRLPGFGLSAQGRQQAQAVAAALASLRPHAHALHTSPLERAVDTAAPIGQALGLSPVTNDLLIESWSALDGLPRNGWLAPRFWPRLVDPFQPSWAEPFSHVATRMAWAVGDAEQQARGRLAVLVSHQSPIWLGVQAALGKAPGRAAGWLRSLPPWLRRPWPCGTGTITMLLFEGGALARALPPWRPGTPHRCTKLP